MKLHIVESAGSYLVVELFSYKEFYFSKIHPETFKTLDKAEKYVTMLDEDGCPVNSVSGGNIAHGAADMGITPFLLRKEIQRRKKPA